ncbi:hypothetical protein NTCA1_00410 [Novosphingobium sp. TCA1]|nr:hypothetical protein NTCA1_00410 [Novosphingobium sp. TCA1]
MAVESRWLCDGDIFTLNDWLRGMTKEEYDITGGRHTPNCVVVYFASNADAMWFKLAWGGA